MARRETIRKRLRLERGLSQCDLGSPGLSYAYISRIEPDARTPSVKALRLMANRLGVWAIGWVCKPEGHRFDPGTLHRSTTVGGERGRAIGRLRSDLESF